MPILASEALLRGSIPTGGNILSLDFFTYCSKASDANIGIIANFVYLWKIDYSVATISAATCLKLHTKSVYSSIPTSLMIVFVFSMWAIFANFVQLRYCKVDKNEHFLAESEDYIYSQIHASELIFSSTIIIILCPFYCHSIWADCE